MNALASNKPLTLTTQYHMETIIILIAVVPLSNDGAMPTDFNTKFFSAVMLQRKSLVGMLRPGAGALRTSSIPSQ